MRITLNGVAVTLATHYTDHGNDIGVHVDGRFVGARRHMANALTLAHVHAFRPDGVTFSRCAIRAGLTGDFDHMVGCPGNVDARGIRFDGGNE